MFDVSGGFFVIIPADFRRFDRWVTPFAAGVPVRGGAVDRRNGPDQLWTAGRNERMDNCASKPRYVCSP